MTRMENMEAYCRWEIDQKLRRQVEAWIADGKAEEMSNRFDRRLEFGTAGLRAQMGAGLDRMNSVTVMQATQGVAKFLEEKLGVAEVKQRGVAVGFDARHNSELFAAVTAMVFLTRGIRVWFHPAPVPTPIVAYTAKCKKAAGAIVITASHNPKDDNGYKLYGDDACQIIAPQDTQIQSLIEKNQEPWADYKSASIATVTSNRLCACVTDVVVDQYISEVLQKLRFGDPSINRKAARLVYSAFHGVGGKFVARLFADFGLPQYIPVLEQLEPDGDFPTVAFPNPEEGAGAMELSIKTADQHGALVILANDPDADRLAAAEKQSDGQWKLFSGNEMAVLFAEWMWKHVDKTEPEKYGMVSSAVSSKFLQAMGSKEGFQFKESLTGFKWLAHAALDFEHKGICPLLTYEEAIGFMLRNVVYDKDGLSAAVVFAELTADTYASGKNLLELLNEQFSKYGHHLSYNGYTICSDPAQMAGAFRALRNIPLSTSIKGAKIVSIRDVISGTDTAAYDGRCDLPSAGGTDFITFRFTSGLEVDDPKPDLVVSFRASGTEPKFKYYSELRCPTSLITEARMRLSSVVQALIDATSTSQS